MGDVSGLRSLQKGASHRQAGSPVPAGIGGGESTFTRVFDAADVRP
jgi:hypothetical protein